MASGRTAEFAAKQISSLLERLLYEMHRCAKDPAPAPVHDLRVSIRRFNQGCRTFRKFLQRREIQRIRKKLKDVMTLAGSVRDRDIAMGLAEKAGLAASLECAPRLKTERQIASEALVEELRRHTRRVHLMRWRSTIKSAPQNPGRGSLVAPFAAKRLPKLVAAFFSAGRNLLTAEADSSSLHALRLRGKRLRYSLELFRPIFGPVLQQRIETMRKVQNILGDVNDCIAASGLLLDSEQSPHSTEFRAYLKRREARRAREFRSFWMEEFGKPDEEDRWKTYLERFAGRARKAPA